MSQPIKILIVGSSGRVGQELVNLASVNKSFDVVGGVERHEIKNSNLKTWTSLKKVTGKVDVVIDFSTPALLSEVVEFCLQKKCGLVYGTTGYSDRDLSDLKKLAKKQAVLVSSNMSTGVALLRQALRSLSADLGFEFHIEDIHHKHKKDAPSGTALSLREDLKALSKQAIPVTSIRAGHVFGIHRVYGFSEHETLTFEHVAYNRSVFAAGALRAAQWLKEQAAGFYQFDQTLPTEKSGKKR